MADLKTNYVDDVLNTSVNAKRKYNMIQNADGTVSFDDVTAYTQNGDSFGAKDVNDTNTAVNELNENLTAFNVDTQTYSTETFKFAKSGEDLGMLDSEGNFMAFGGNMVNIQCFNNATTKYTFQGDYKKVVLVKNGRANDLSYNFSLNDVELSTYDWTQVTADDYQGMSLSYAIINDVKENDVLKCIGSSITQSYAAGMAIF